MAHHARKNSVKRRKKLNSVTTEHPKMLKPTAIRIYLRLGRHLDHTTNYPCDHCYTKGDSLIIQGDVTTHIKSIVGSDFAHINLDTVVNDLQDFGLILCTKIREGLHELALLREPREPKGNKDGRD